MTSIDADSFERLVRPHMPALFRAAYRWAGNTEDAKDLVQDVCIAACGHLEQLDTGPGPRPWLLRVLYHRARRSLKRHLDRLDNEGGATARLGSAR